MGFEAAITIRAALREIEEGRWVIPAFQRDLVWPTEKVELLFDSLMRDYTIGGLLLWSVDKEMIDEFRFDQFVQHYHERDRKSGGRASLKGRENIKAVLDGQQRLTALYLGLRGSYTDRLRYGRGLNPATWPARTLHLNLRVGLEADAPDDENVPAFEFRFLTEMQVAKASDALWFPVADVLGFDRLGGVRRWFSERGITPDDAALDLVDQLRNVVWDKPLISYYLEPVQDLHKVVTVFQRINKAGTTLSMAAVVFSTAVEQWHGDARGEIDGLISELNSFGRPNEFRFNRDFVLKACLVLSEIANIRFDVGNYGAENMGNIERRWPSIKGSLRLTARLLGAFGYNGTSLTSLNAVIPLACYIGKIGNPGDFLTSAAHGADRRLIRRWLAEALVRGVFSGHSDTKLTAARESIRVSSGGFPAEAIMSSLRLPPVTDDEISRLLDATYGSPQGFAVLSLLYPSFPYDQPFDLDHIHPQSFASSSSKLASQGLTGEAADYYVKHVNEIPNLQLLAAAENNEKRATPFAEFLRRHRPEPGLARRYCEDNFIPEGDLATANFQAFFEARRKLLATGLRTALVAPPEHLSELG